MLDCMLKNFPCALLFHVMDAWLTSKDLGALDCSIAGKVMREEYLRVLATGKILQRHSLILDDCTMDWMTSRNVTVSSLRLTLSQFAHLLSPKYTPFQNLRFVKQLSVTCDGSFLADLQLDDLVFARFPMLTSLSFLSSWDHTLPMRDEERFSKLIAKMLRSSPLLQTIEFSRLEVVTDSLVHSICTTSSISHLLLDCCPMVSCRGVKQSLGHSRVLSELSWRSLDPLPSNSSEFSEDDSDAADNGTTNSTAGLCRLSLLGPGFTAANIIDLSSCSTNLHSLSVSHADVLDEEDAVQLAERLGTRLSAVVLLRCRLVSSQVLDSFTLNCRASRLTCLRLHSLHGSRQRRQQVTDEDGSCSRLSHQALLRLAAKHGAHLQHLQLSGVCGVSDRMVHAVSKMCVRIQQLDLTENDLLTDQALHSLVSCAPNTLRQLVLSPSRSFSDAARVALHQRLQDRLRWQ